VGGWVGGWREGSSGSKFNPLGSQFFFQFAPLRIPPFFLFLRLYPAINMEDTPDAVRPLWLSLLSRFLALRPFSRTNPEGVRAALELLAEELQARGFDVQRHANPSDSGAGVIVAYRAPRGGCPRTIGMFGHVDVETVAPGEAWLSEDPMVPQLLSDGRYYARGIGDNLGPLLARLVAFDAADAVSAGVVWVVHGEEEVGSKFAHALLPDIKAATAPAAAVDADVGGNPSPYTASATAIARAQLWLEETGYYAKDGTQRVLCMYGGGGDGGIDLGGGGDGSGDAPLSYSPIVDFALAELRKNVGGRPLSVLHRFLNKGLGGKRCPCVTHLVDGSTPYLSFGINDSHSSIHSINESVPADTLAAAHAQFRAVMSIA
jgi:hypothetical protein